MAQIDHLPPLREVIDNNGLAAKKSLGQNFLRDLNLTAKIARSAGDLSHLYVIEIGPGPGGLTRGLLASGAKKVIAIERDERCRPILQDISDVYQGQLDVHFRDALATDLSKLVGSHPACIIANLPYNISTALLANWLEQDIWPPFYNHLTLMFQKEVAERIVAQAGTKAYGRLSILAQWRCSAEILFHVPREAFTPPPKVTSSIVHLVPREHPMPCRQSTLSHVTALAFGQRRKMLRTSLKQLKGIDVMRLLDQAGIIPTMRAEALSVADFVKLANAYDALDGS